MMSISPNISQMTTLGFLRSESGSQRDLILKLERFYRIEIFENFLALQEHLTTKPDSLDLIIYSCDQDNERELFKILDSTLWPKIRTMYFWVLLESDDLTLMRYLFHKGIDDVFCMPLHLSEFQVKLDRALAKKQYVEEHNHFCDLSRERFDLNDFTKTEARILSLFFSAREKKFTRLEIIQLVWGRKVSQHQKNLNVHLHNLRKKLAPYGYSILNTSRGEWTIIRTTKTVNLNIPSTELIL